MKLLKDRHVILCPTLVVFERYGRTFSHQLNLTGEEQKWGNPEVIASLDVTKIPRDKLPDRIKIVLDKPDEALARIKKTYDIALPNLKRLEDAGVTIAAGTDGKHRHDSWPGAFPRISVDEGSRSDTNANSAMRHRERRQAFRRRNRRAYWPIQKGDFADLVILNSNPLSDIKNASDIDTVIKNGVVYPVDSILQ